MTSGSGNYSGSSSDHCSVLQAHAVFPLCSGRPGQSGCGTAVQEDRHPAQGQPVASSQYQELAEMAYAPSHCSRT